MATHANIFVCRIPWPEEPGKLHFTGLQSQTRLSDFTFTFTFLHCRLLLLLSRFSRVQLCATP